MSAALISIYSGSVACNQSPRPATSKLYINVLMRSASEADSQLIRQFTRETGIAVHLAPAPESSAFNLAQDRDLLQRRSHQVDVMEREMVWAAQLSNLLLDLGPYLQDRSQDELPRPL